MVDVRLFARARDLAGADQVKVELPAGATVAHLRSHLISTYPLLAPIARSLLFAIENAYASDFAPIPPESQIACFPPVSGG